MQRETAGMRELRLEVPLGSTVDDAWSAVVGSVPALAPGRASLRFAVNGTYADPDTALADGDEVALHPAGQRRRGGDPGRRILEIRAAPFPADLVETLTERLATDEDGGVVAFIGRTRATPGTPAPGPGGRGRPPRGPPGRRPGVRGVRVDGGRGCSRRSPTRSRPAGA